MNITKYIHACLDITVNEQRIIVDPGAFTDPLEDYSGVTAVVITHTHEDHLDESKIHKLAKQNPSLVIYCTQQAADKLSENMRITVPEIGVQYSVGSTRLEFFGGLHSVILDGMPQDENFGVLIDNTLYYPGDSLTPCPKAHTVLAAPSTAPWLKLSEAANFITQDSAATVFPTHNGICIEPINDMTNMMLAGVAKEAGKTYRVLKPGESIEV
ncbi:MBL fold metallo-hydrolase [Aeromicrobium sp.]|nr:MBL fold metallo-hydrolase [Candidatus Saccharibacteria bacterium]